MMIVCVDVGLQYVGKFTYLHKYIYSMQICSKISQVYASHYCLVDTGFHLIIQVLFSLLCYLLNCRT